MVGGAGGEEFNVGGEQEASEICLVGIEDAARLEGGGVLILVHAPDVHITFVVARNKERAITGDRDGGDGYIVFGDELVGAFVVAQVPDHDHPATVAGNELALVGVDDDVVDRMVVGVGSLNETTSCIPNSYCAILGGGDHPLALAVESDAGDIAVVSFKGHDGIRVGGLDVV